MELKNKSNKKTQKFFSAPAEPPTYWLTRFMILRLLGLIYAVAFLVAINQIVPLIGNNGLLPVSIYLQQVSRALGSNSAGFFRLPSLFWLWHSDTALLTIAWVGFLLSLVVMAGYANALMLLLLWFFYMSFVHVGQEWYGYGWEIQLTETGFLAIFLCPLIDARPFPKRAPPVLIIILFRWLIFRIMMGSALIKLRGDEMWRNGTALYYHFQTQPIPNPLSRWFHFLPRAVLKIGSWFNFLAELAAPLFVFGPKIARHIAGVVIVLFQLNIILSGNLSFLNWLTIVPALACFDDSFWKIILPKFLVRKSENAANHYEESKPMIITARIVTVIIIFLSVEPALNLISTRQVMNTSFDPLDIVNTYGAFGTVGRERFNIVFEGTMDEQPADNAHWIPYLYKGLPVLLNEQPPQIAPYQLRLDWQMWFAAMSTPDEYPWTYHLIWKLLHNDEQTLSLFANNPFPAHPPKFIRAVLYRYIFAKPDNAQHLWWTREFISNWIPATSVSDSQLIKLLQNEGWMNKQQ